ncbi:uncharacterized protein [Henckelia pumila]|uniref:uncharacterized protein n=1 Tax=Henckelia pumila TaxID=405737 RepID=UPI003C6E8D58
MGIILSLCRVSGWKTEGDEARRLISPNLTPPFSTLFQRLGQRSRCTLKRIWLIICSVPISIWRCLKGGIFHRIKSIFYLTKPRKSAGPLLPIENPAPMPSDHPPLERALLVSTEQNNQEDSRSGTKNTKDHATISIPSFSSHVLDSYSTSSITDSAAAATQENAPRENVSYAMHEETGMYISAGEICEGYSSDPSEVKNVVDSVTIFVPNFRDNALEYSAGLSIYADSAAAAIIQDNVPQKNESYAAEHEDQRICISTEKKYEGSYEEKESNEAGEKVIETTVVAEEKPRWIKHYSSCHRILLVGEGDFSFSFSLAKAFGCASKMVATSLDSKAFLKKNYAMAPWNIGELKKKGCIVMHGIDATTIATHHQLKHMTFDRIIFNFPFAGFFEGLSRDSTLRRHRRLVSLFLKNAKGMIDGDGEIHISHKTNEHHNEWKLVSMASSHGLRLIEEVTFDLSDYPGYNTKRGFGGDGNFVCYPSSTFKFGLKFVGH